MQGAAFLSTHRIVAHLSPVLFLRRYLCIVRRRAPGRQDLGGTGFHPGAVRDAVSRRPPGRPARDEGCGGAARAPGGGEVPPRGRGFGLGAPRGSEQQLGPGGGHHAPARGGHHQRGHQPVLHGRQLQGPGQAAATAESQPGGSAAKPEPAAETEAAPHPLHPGTAQRAGEELRQDPLPGYLHEGRAGPEDRPDRVQSAGLVPEPPCQVEKAQEDHQRVPLTRDPPAHPGTTPVPISGSCGGGSDGRQPVLLPCQRHPLGHCRDGGLSAPLTPVPGQAAGHGTVSVTVQSGRRPPTRLHGPVKHGLQWRGAAVTPLPIRLPWHGAHLIAGSRRQRVGIPTAVQLPGHQRRVEGDQHRLSAPQSIRAHSLHELYLIPPPTPTPPPNHHDPGVSRSKW